MTEEERLLSAASQEAEASIEKSLRPQFLAQYIGQDKVKQELTIYIEAAKNRNEALDHTLLYGPPGLGKTTMAMVIANEMNVNIRTTSGPAIERAGDLVAILNELEPGDVLFIDEIHRLPRVVEEMLYSAMEDFYIDIMVGQGTTAHPVHFPLPAFYFSGRYHTGRDAFSTITRSFWDYFSHGVLSRAGFKRNRSPFRGYFSNGDF